MHMLLGSCLGFISGKEWKDLRRATEEPFTRSAAVLNIPAIRLRARQLLSELWKEKTTSCGDQPLESACDVAYIHPVHDFKHYPFLTIAETIYGNMPAGLEQRLVGLIPAREHIFKRVIQGGITRFRISHLLPLRINHVLRNFKEEWAQWNDDVHEVARLEHQAKDESKAIPAILGLYQAVERGRITREQLSQTLDEMLFANLDVTVGALSWPFIFLAAHPSVQEKLRREIRLHRNNDISASTVEDSYVFSSGTYLHSIVLEAARLRPLVAFSTPQSCPTVRLVSGYLVPAGTNFVVDTYALNIRNEVWSPDNYTFRPERWLEAYERKVELRYCYWRFGFGPRSCMGKYVADAMIKILIIELVTGWDLMLDNDNDWKYDEETWIHHPAMRIKCVQRNE